MTELVSPAGLLADALAASRCRTSCFGFEFLAGDDGFWTAAPMARPSRVGAPHVEGLTRTAAMILPWIEAYAEAAQKTATPLQLLGGAFFLRDPVERGFLARRLFGFSGRVVRALGADRADGAVDPVDVSAFAAALSVVGRGVVRSLHGETPPGGLVFEVYSQTSGAAFFSGLGDSEPRRLEGEFPVPRALTRWLEGVHTLGFRFATPGQAAEPATTKEAEGSTAEAQPVAADGRSLQGGTPAREAPTASAAGD